MAIKAATLLRDNASKFRQIIGQYYGWDTPHPDIAVPLPPQRCAVGLLMTVTLGNNGNGVPNYDASDPRVRAALPCLYRDAVLCPEVNCTYGAHVDVKNLPACGMYKFDDEEDLEKVGHPWRYKIANLIAHLNDDHRYTFEQIGVFLESIAEEPVACPTQAKCKNCDGTGEVHSHNPSCWVCGGTGTAKEKGGNG